MKRFRITMLVPHSTIVVVPDAQAAHNEATRLAEPPTDGSGRAIVQSIEEIDEIQTEPIDFGITFDEENI
jgi:hypothetical protein